MKRITIYLFTNLVTGTTDDGRENSSGSIISSKPCFAHSRSFVNDKSCNIFVTHPAGLFSYPGPEEAEFKLELRDMTEVCILERLGSALVQVSSRFSCILQNQQFPPTQVSADP